MVSGELTGRQEGASVEPDTNGSDVDRLKPVRAVLAAALTLIAVAWAADLFSVVGLVIYTEQFLAAVLALSLALTFMREPHSSHRRGRTRLTLDLLAGAASFAAAAYLAMRYPDLLSRQMQVPTDGMIVCGILFVAILEGVRRTLGPMLVLVVLAVVGYSMIGHMIAGPLQTRAVPSERMLLYLGLDSNGMLGITLLIAATIVIAFILFGQLLIASGGGAFFNDLALSLMGRQRGGSAKIAIVGSGLFGTISGVVVSNIVATGVITIRIMIKGGFKRSSAAAIEATASTGGQILPPIMGAVAFLMAEILQIPYSEVVIAAIVPALLFYIAIFIQADLEAAKNGIKPVDESMIPSLGSVLRQGWVFMLPFAVVIGGLFVFNLRPETSAFLGAVTALGVGVLCGYGDDRLRWRDLAKPLSRTGNAVLDVVLIAAAAGYLIGALNITGLGFSLSYTMVQLGQSNLFFLLLIAAVVCIILGMGMPTVGVYLILSVMVAPALVDVGIEPIAAHLFIFYLGMMSMVTPPVAIAAFFAASIAQANKMRTAFKAMRFGWVAYVIPFLFVVTPSLLLDGPWYDIALDVGASVLGVWLISAAAVGYMNSPLSHLMRLAVGGVGLLFLIPDHLLIDGFHLLDMAALLIVAGYAVQQVVRPKARETA